MKRKRNLDKIERQLEKKFVQHWSPHEEKKEYTALQDPHAKYYFYNKSVNEHLKVLKKVIKNEKNEKEKQKLRSQIQSNLSAVRLPVLNTSIKAAIYEAQVRSSLKESAQHRRKKSEMTIKTGKNKNSVGENKQSSFSVVEMKRYKKSSEKERKNNSIEKIELNTENLKQDKGASRQENFEQESRISHEKFLEFLIQRKKKIKEFAKQRRDVQDISLYSEQAEIDNND